MKLRELTGWLDEYLRVREVPDDKLALNGLQVDGPADVTRVAVAVDACQAVIDEAARQQVQLLIVHHGLFWDGLGPVTGRRHARLASLMRHGIALYGSHLPLDCHPDVGNNAVLARLLGVPVSRWWGDYQGVSLGVAGELALDRAELGSRIASVLGAPPKLIAGGPGRTKRVGIVTGAAGSMIEEAHAAGIDTFITGEGKHHHYFDAEELGVNVFFAGHYATETVGVKALAEQLAARFGLAWTFIDHPTGL